MTNYVGRTIGKFFKFQLDDGTAMRDLPVNTIGGVGITNDEVDVSALQEALKSFLLGQGSVKLTIGGPLSNSAAVAASGTGAVPALSGSHTVLVPLSGVLTTPLSFGVYLGMQQYWTAGDPVFGGINVCFVSNYTADPVAMTYSANINLHPSRTVDPIWGTAAITAS
jgi:hypothetical protein